MADIEVITLSQAVETIKTAILQSQARAARSVSANQLALYFSVGGYISLNTRQQQWGSGAIKSISDTLQKELPGLQGFSAESINKMRRFYEEWSAIVFQSPLATKTENAIQQPMAGEIQSPVATQLQLTPSRLDFSRDVFDVEMAHDFLSISFTHHMEILFKTETLEQRLFYIQKSAEFNWNKYELRDQLKKDLYGHQSLMPNNFLKSLPKHSQALKAIEMFKDEYLLDYINVEQLNVRDKSDVDEKIVEQEIIHNVKNFIMMFGHDFTFVGNQYHLEKFGENEFIDLLKPSYLGQLQSYLQILDTDIRKPNENPSIGIILCREANKAYVEFVIQKYDSPMGVATYKTAADMPEELRKALPDEEKLKELLSGDSMNQ